MILVPLLLVIFDWKIVVKTFYFRFLSLLIASAEISYVDNSIFRSTVIKSKCIVEIFRCDLSSYVVFITKCSIKNNVLFSQKKTFFATHIVGIFFPHYEQLQVGRQCRRCSATATHNARRTHDGRTTDATSRERFRFITLHSTNYTIHIPHSMVIKVNRNVQSIDVRIHQLKLWY